MKTKVTRQELVDFELRYFDAHSVEFKHLRYGQAFLNTCLPGVVNPDLFYEADIDISRSVVWLDFVE